MSKKLFALVIFGLVSSTGAWANQYQCTSQDSTAALHLNTGDTGTRVPPTIEVSVGSTVPHTFTYAQDNIVGDPVYTSTGWGVLVLYVADSVGTDFSLALQDSPLNSSVSLLGFSCKQLK